ncbi:Chaperone protein DnaK [Sandaracinus amylolyticus]|uniref:Chaperone protein DnaK n=1 Tax=Sandaracinus amylolyticus TaxID=927083 RepID=A0A0F6W9S8_9BACT|nr:Chaperone protein DnaK [Sandaracinus amylolyticus]
MDRGAWYTSRPVASHEPRYIVGIDLGTTHTVVAYGPADASAPPRIFAIDQLIAPGEIEARPLLHSLRYHPAPGEISDDDLALPWGETPAIPGSEGRYVVGELARELGAKVPGRLVASAKSWLSHPSVDRTAPILPWGAAEDVPKVSAVVASASYLAHVKAAWDHHHPREPLDEQEVVLTIPASFDEGGRALTLEAARLAGLPRVRLLEEPQAAFYDWLARRGVDAAEAAGATKLAMVVDVGGGTTDLTLIRVEIRDSGPRLTRIAVGDHLMLGGDNMDLALAHDVEARLGTGGGGKLGAGRFTQLLVQCRTAKERLLGSTPPESVRVTVLGSGSKLVGGATSAEITRADVDARLVEGFFPLVGLDARPQKRAGAIVEFGLPYVADPAVTRHVAGFLARHEELAREALGPDGPAVPDAVLLNGGVFRGGPLAARMIGQLESWRGAKVRVLENDDPELAVARGAVAYGLARRGVGLRIGGGSARSYFLLLPPVSEDAPRRGLCLLPRGAEEGEEVTLEERTFSLKLGQPVRFLLASSTGQAAYVRAGEIVDVDDELFRDLPPLAAVLDDERTSATSSGQLRAPSIVPGGSTAPAAPREEHVKLAAGLTEIGTLELSCLQLQESAEAKPSRRWKLELQLRGGSDETLSAQRITQLHPRFKEARAKIEAVYGKSEAGLEGKPQKTLRTDLEKILGPRAQWSTPLLRELWGALFAGTKRRRRSADHERVWFNLIGFCLRPGFGYPLDDWRVRQLWTVFDQGVQFAPEAQNWSEWWTLWRRVAGGLDQPMQQKVLSSIEWYLHPPTPRPRPRPAGPKALGYDDMVRLAASLERIAPSDKARIGDWLIERLTQHGENVASWWAVGRIGARVPFSGSAHHVVARAKAEDWLAQVMKLDWRKVEPAAFAAAQLARRTGDRERDLDAQLAAQVAAKLRTTSAPESWVRMVSEVAELEAAEEQRIFGESLPPGLRLIS